MRLDVIVENPYLTPNTEECAVPDDASIPLRIEGTSVVVHDGAVFPLRCVLSGEPVDESSLTRHRLESLWSEIWPKRVHVVFGMSAAVRRRYRIYAGVRFATGFVAIALMYFHFGTVGYGLRIFALTVLALVANRIPLCPLKISKRQGDQFWITGFGPAFLNELRSCTRNSSS